MNIWSNLLAWDMQKRGFKFPLDACLLYLDLIVCSGSNAVVDDDPDVAALSLASLQFPTVQAVGGKDDDGKEEEERVEKRLSHLFSVMLETRKSVPVSRGSASVLEEFTKPIIVEGEVPKKIEGENFFFT